jgi:hypothetical protein
VPDSPGKIITSSDDWNATPAVMKKDRRGSTMILILKQTFLRVSFIYWQLAQREFNDLVRDLDLFKKQTELLAFRSKSWNLLLRGTRVSYIRNHHE